MIMAANGRTDRNEERASIARASCLPFCRPNTGAVDALRWQMHLEAGVFTSITTADTTTAINTGGPVMTLFAT